LEIATDWGGTWSILRRLVLLGHLEFDASRNFRWGVIPPTLVTTADGEHQVLVGQRTPTLIHTFHENHHLNERPQTGGPPRLLITPNADGLYYRASRQVRTVGCVSRQLSDLLPDLREWQHRLPAWEERDFARFQTQHYDPYTDELRDIAPIVGKPSSGMYRFVFDHGPQRIVTVAFYDDKRHQWACGDYYGLRFLARSCYRLCRAIYLGDSQQIVIPVSDRWPMPYERALVLASGALPQRVQPEYGPPVLLYEGITQDLATQLCGLLGLKMGGS